jgi:hypothetical protein
MFSKGAIKFLSKTNSFRERVIAPTVGWLP